MTSVDTPAYPRWATPGDPLQRLPKVSLHDHLDGSIRPETLIELAVERGVTLPHTDPATLAGWFQLTVTEPVIDNWDDMFGLTTSVMQDAAGLTRVAREFVLELAADGVVYGEARWAPEKHEAPGFTMDDAVEAVTRGLTEGERLVEEQGDRIRVRQLLCGMRTSERSLEIAELTVRHKGDSVAGFDLAGEENGFSVRDHLPAFRLLDDADIPYTIHSGEHAGVESLADTIHLCHPERIGHGTKIVEDFTLDGVPLVAATAVASVRANPDGELVEGPLARRMRDRRIPFEFCVSSNSGGHIVDERRDHPIGLLRGLGYTVTVNPDNRLLAGTCSTREFRYIADEFGWTADDFLEATLAGLDAAFLTQSERRRILEEQILPGYEAWAAEFGES